jgi:RNA polymerase sigma-70 factor (ECF subfamily)
LDEHETRLIERIRRGDGEAHTLAAELVRLHHASVYRLLANLTRDTHLAEDLCQETFTTAWTKLAGFRGDCAVGTWLHRIAYRRFLDWRRSAERTKALSDGIERRIAANPLVGLVEDEEARALWDSLGRLDDADREVLALHYLQDLSYREIADITGEPVGTIKWRTSAALGRLRRLLATDQNDEPGRTTRPDRAAARPSPAGGAAGA